MSYRQQKRYPLRLVYQLMIILLLMSVGPLFFSSRKLTDISQKSLENTILNLHTQSASRLRESVEMFLENVRETLVELSRIQGMTDILGTEELQSLLVNFLGSHDHIAGIKVYGPQGREVVTVSRDQSLNPAFRNFSRNSLEEPLGSRYNMGQPMTVAGYPGVLLPVTISVHSSSGESQGILVALVDLKPVQKMVAETRVGRQGSAFLVDSTGRTIAHKDPRKVETREDLTDLEIVGSYVLAGRTGGTIPFTGEDGQPMLGAYDLIEDVGWGVVIEEPKADAYISLEVMRKQTMIWLIIVSLLAVALAAVLAHRISKPIRVFAGRALSVAQGDFHGQIDVRSRNEIGQLADTFNFMIRELDLYDKNMRDLFLSTIKSLAAAVDAKDPYTRGHSERVTLYSVAIARSMGLEGRELEDIQAGALLHDVGKIGIDDSILRKPGKLSEGEYSIMKMHPVFGANIMSPIKQLREIIPGMKYHHEHYNGAGYPEGLEKDEIPLIARIIAVADAFDAMTSDRPYQKAMNDADGIKTLIRLMGIRYDPQVVQAFVAAYPELGRDVDWEASTEIPAVSSAGKEEG
jgi:HD-GYP domain-containing protein (c-di-GMP phosphodiesterase class II)